MIGAQHQRAPQQTGAGGIDTPGRGERFVNGPVHGGIAGRLGDRPQRDGRIDQQGLRTARPQAGSGAQTRHVAQAARDRRAGRTGTVGRGGQRRKTGRIPQQGRHILQARGRGEAQRVLAAIPQRAIGDAGDPRGQHRLTEIDGGGGDRLAGPAAMAARHQGLDAMRVIQAAARIIRQRASLHQATADIGIQGLARAAETRAGGFGGEPAGDGSIHVDQH